VRLGVFSDVHANLEALEAVLAAYQKAQIDCYVCLGDVVGYGANPNECCELVRQCADLAVMGNHDAACSGRMSTERFNEAARAAVEKHQQMLDPHHLRWLAQLPYHIALDDQLFCHGSPYREEEFPYILDEIDVEESLGHTTASQPLIFVGHTHRGTTFIYRDGPVPRVREDASATVYVSAGERYLFNVGSVGQPRDGDWRAAYAIFDTDAGTFELHRTEYDIDTASQNIANLGLPLVLSERLWLGL
jgi:diadenosine tetraphosphatase ApaH/serine/threonine PP2A family protein phosphatase